MRSDATPFIFQESSMIRKTTRRGFTLIQLLVVLAVILLLIGLLLPAVQKVRAAAAKAQSANNLKQICIAMHNADSTFGNLPPSVGKYSGQDGTFFFHILPYIEQDNVYKAKALQTVIKTYIAPADASQPGNQPWISYASNADALKVNPQKLMRLPDFTKGTSHTIVFTERYGMCGNKAHPWADTGELATFIHGMTSMIEFNVPPQKAGNGNAQNFTPGSCMVSIADGSVRGISPEMKLATFRWACDPASNMAAPADW
jgi:type II secretory pathway pseudopilin PulG